MDGANFTFLVWQAIGYRRRGSNFKSVISKHMLWITFMGTSCEIALRWIPQNIFDDKSTLVQVIVGACWHQAITWRNVDPDLCCHFGITKPQWVNSLGPSDAIWHWRPWSTLVQVMACGLTAPSHYLNQCWLIISKVLWHSSEDIIIRRFEDTS